jgi:hypothetical protein
VGAPSGTVTSGWVDASGALKPEAPPHAKRFYDLSVRLRSRLGEERFDALARRGAGMRDDELVDLVREVAAELLAVPRQIA